jgi:serine/threonine-protein kinase
MVGTPAFMAPEQMSGAMVDARSDIYSLACLAYDLLTGQHLFKADNFFDLVKEKLLLRLPPAEKIGDGISAELHDLLRAALSVEPADRPASVAALVEWAAPCAPLPPDLVAALNASDQDITR